MTNRSACSFLNIKVEEFDSLGDKSVVTAKEAELLEEVRLAGGLLTPPEILTVHRICQRLSDGARILEIGSFLGGSTIAMGRAIKGKAIELYCIDCWSYHEDVLQQFVPGTTAKDYDIWVKFQNSTAFIGEQLRIMKGTTEQFSDLMSTAFFDLVFVDAGHDYKDVLFDIILGLRVLKPGGLIFGHDFHTSGEGVCKAVNELIADSNGIAIRDVVPETSIWYAIVDDPAFEHARSKLIAKAIEGENKDALDMAFKLVKDFPDREEATRILDEILAIKYGRKTL